MSKKKSITMSIVNVLIWGTAVIFACKWFGFILDGLISFNSPYGTGTLIIMCYVAVAGAIISLLLALLNCRRRISLLVQIPMLIFGMMILWAICPYITY